MWGMLLGYSGNTSHPSCQFCTPKSLLRAGGRTAGRRRCWLWSTVAAAAAGNPRKAELEAQPAAWAGPRNSAGAADDARSKKDAQKQINAELCAAASVEGVLGMLAEHSCEAMGDLNAVTAFHRLAKNAGGSSRARREVLASPHLARLVAYLERPSMQWSAIAVANVFWAHAVLAHGSKALINKAFRQLDRISVQDSKQCFATLVHAMAKLGQPHAGYLRRLSASLAEEAQHAQRGTAQTAGSQRAPRQPRGTSLEQHQQHFGAMDSGAGQGSLEAAAPPTPLLGRLNTQQLCLFVYSLASLGCTDGSALRVCLEEIARRDLSSLSATSLCQVTRALVAGELYHHKACDAVAAAVAQLPDRALDGESCSRLLHDYGLVYQMKLVGEGHDPSHRLQWQAAVRGFVRQVPTRRAMLHRLAQRAQQEMGAMGAISLSSLVWGLATLGQRQGPLLDAVAARAMQLGTQLDAHAVVSICWAFAALSHDHPQMMEALAGTALALLSDPARRSEFTAQAVPMLAMNYAVLNRCDSPVARAMLEALAGRAAEVLPELTPQGLSNLGWGLAVGRAFPLPLARTWRATVASCLPQFSPLQLNQLHQVEVALRMEALAPEPQRAAGGRALESYDALLESLYQSGRMRSAAKRGWERQQQWGHRTVTRWQEKIYGLLCELGVECELEHLGAGAEYSADIAILSQRIAVECDGPSHFMANSRHVEGGTALKRRLLAQLGWRVVTIPYFDWPARRQQQVEYLAEVLGEAGLQLAAESLPRPEGSAGGSGAAARSPQPRTRRQRKPSVQHRPHAAAPGGPEGTTAAAAPASNESQVVAPAEARELQAVLPYDGDAVPHTIPSSSPASSSASNVESAGARGMGWPSGQPGGATSTSQGGNGEAGGIGKEGEGQGNQAAPDGDVGASSPDASERARRLTLLRYKSGKLSRSQMLLRQGRGSAAQQAAPDGA